MTAALPAGEVYDFSFAHATLSPESFIGTGAAGVIGYVGADPAKCITPDEVAAYRAAGLAVGLVHERGADYTTWDGAAANRAADAIGFPADRPIYYACDRDVPRTEFLQVQAALEAQPGPRPKGIYAGKALVCHMLVGQIAVVGWGTSATSWDHGGCDLLALQQHFGGSPVPQTDRNTVLLPDWGQWAPESEPDMGMTAQEFHDQVLGGDPQVPGTLTWADVIRMTAELTRDNATAIARVEAKVDALAAGGPGGGGPTATAIANAVLAGLVEHPLTPRA